MDQQKIGRFLRRLRSERGLTQEQAAEELNVSNRSVSRWENGTNLPDLGLLMQLAGYYGLEVGELLDGERKGGEEEPPAGEALLKVADYHRAEQEFFTRRIRWVFLAALAGMAVYMVFDLLGLLERQPYASIVDVILGLVMGALLTGLLYSTHYITRVRAAKLRILRLIRAAVTK